MPDCSSRTKGRLPFPSSPVLRHGPLPSRPEELSFLTDAEKDALIADYNRLVELDNQLCKLYDTIWGNTGCENGICPF